MDLIARVSLQNAFKSREKFPAVVSSKVHCLKLDINRPKGPGRKSVNSGPQSTVKDGLQTSTI